MRRRTLLVGGALAGGAVAAGATVTAAGAYERYFGSGPAPVVPDAPPGDERVEPRMSPARGRTVDFYTAVPAGHGDGRGLPVCLVLHGGSKRPADFAATGLGRFLTDAVRRGTPPFVLAGATGDRLAWRPHWADDPQRMVREEIPAWCAERGFDTGRTVAWGWSMGGSGALLLAAAFPGWLRAVAAFSPAVRPGDDVFAAADRLRGLPVGLWCGEQDGLVDDVRALARAVPPVAGGRRRRAGGPARPAAGRRRRGDRRGAAPGRGPGTTGRGGAPGGLTGSVPGGKIFSAYGCRCPRPQGVAHGPRRIGVLDPAAGRRRDPPGDAARAR